MDEGRIGMGVIKPAAQLNYGVARYSKSRCNVCTISASAFRASCISVTQRGLMGLGI